MYPCTTCGLPLSGPVCPRCGQVHSAPGRPVPQQPSSTAPTPTPWDVPASGPAMIPGQTVLPPQAPPAVPAPEPVRGSGPGVAVLTGVLSAVVLLTLGLLAWFFLFGGQGDTAAEPAPTAPAATSTPAPPVEVLPSVTPSTGDASPSATASSAQSALPGTPVVTEYVTVDPQEAARLELEALREESLAMIELDGRWVAVLSTKKNGTTDPLQTARNGTNVFYDEDILALHKDLAAYFWEDAPVLLVRSSDFGPQPRSGDVFWRTFADRAFTSEADVTEWCALRFSGTAKEIENFCLARQLVPPTQS